jgi:outer membrane protein TolC
MNWTLTDFGATRANVDMARSSQAELTAQLRQQEQELAFKVSESYKKMSEAKQRVHSLAINVEQADEAQRLVKQRHEGGVATMTEVLVAETQRLKAKADLISARHEVSTQNASVRLLMGELDEALF